MISIFKRREIVLDCITNAAHAYDYAPIRRASKFLPSWWMDLPPNPKIEGDLFTPLNMRGCPGFSDLYSVGVMMPMWSDLRIDLAPNGEYRYQYSDSISSAEAHGEEQRGRFAEGGKYSHIKLAAPWLFKTKDDIGWLMLPAFYNNEDPAQYLTCLGALNFVYQHAVNVNLLMPLSPDRKLIEFKHGSPLAHLVPLTDKKIKIRNHLVDESEWRRLSGKHRRISFSRNYHAIKKVKKDGCPFA